MVRVFEDLPFFFQAELGFDGKTLIHPKQVDTCNEIFTPSTADVEKARRIIAAYGEAQREGKGVVVVDGHLVENLHVDDARRLIALADEIAAMSS